jgi:hypothetical protein
MNLNTLSVSGVVNRFEMLTGFIHHRISFCLQTFGDFRFTVHMAGKARRFFLVHFNKSHIQRQLLQREGDCRQCGACCNLLFTCPTLTKNGRCLIYGVCRPGACKVFPIDQRDIDEVRMCGGKCGYGFRKTDLSNPFSTSDSHADCKIGIDDIIKDVQFDIITSEVTVVSGTHDDDDEPGR